MVRAKIAKTIAEDINTFTTSKDIDNEINIDALVTDVNHDINPIVNGIEKSIDNTIIGKYKEKNNIIFSLLL